MKVVEILLASHSPGKEKPEFSRFWQNECGIFATGFKSAQVARPSVRPRRRKRG
jgi:hypothetical protein